MRTITMSIAIAAALALAVPAEAKRSPGIEGTVTTSTCAGPCIYPPPPSCPPCTDQLCPLRPCVLPPCPTRCANPSSAALSGVTVTVTRLATGKVMAVRHPADGSFRARLRPGRYAVKATDSSTCVSAAETEARVRRGRFAHVALQLQYTCAA